MARKIGLPLNPARTHVQSSHLGLVTHYIGKVAGNLNRCIDVDQFFQVGLATRRFQYRVPHEFTGLQSDGDYVSIVEARQNQVPGQHRR